MGGFISTFLFKSRMLIMSIINENNNDDDDTNDNENTVETALSPLISWCVTAVTMSFVVSLEHCSCFDHQFQ